MGEVTKEVSLFLNHALHSNIFVSDNKVLLFEIKN